VISDNSFLGASFSDEKKDISMPVLLSDFVLFSFVVMLIAGLVLATMLACADEVIE